ncbi:uncharacterized protein LOC118734840 [Rhagoletis pomonella]|uniref:uncharacterized protein LOC118734840 n=1 Tax=Rhagoletis pomonella TaxID=28610 RepID=UPI00177ECDE4|nr:uncharacterized protein LOC118734840 [Rhagoletis pomonella]
MPPHRKCVFNEEMQNQYKFLKKIHASEVQCLRCLAVFSIANGGKYDVLRHLQSRKHRNADVAASTSKTVLNFVRMRTMDAQGRKTSINEGTWAYHTVKHNFSFRSNDCTSKLIKKCFDENYSSAHTKCEAIVCNVLAPNAMQLVEADLSVVNFIAIFSDCSNHGSMKVCPVLVRYFLPEKGVQLKILEVNDLRGETSDLLRNYIFDLMTKFALSTKLLALCADNTNCSFGGAARRGKNNLFHKLAESTGSTLIGVNCAAHIVNNCIQSSIECLPVDIEVIVVKIFSYFYIYTVRVEHLKEICDTVDVEYKKMLGYSKTRWLTLKPAIERILKLFKPLKKYFLEQPHCPSILKTFFENSTSEMWLLFTHCQASLFHNYITQIESQNICMVEVALLIKQLKLKITERRDGIFLPLMLKKIISEFERAGTENLSEIKDQVKKFYINCIDYLNQWDHAFKEVEGMEWVLLRTMPSWHDVERNCVYIMEKRSQIKINDSELFDEFTCVKNYATPNKLKEWTNGGRLVDSKWAEIFQHFMKNSIPFQNILKIVEFNLCLPGSNAPTERVFSILNNISTDEKSQMKIETVKSILITRCNYELSCLEFREYLQNKENIIKQIYAAEKYQ